jgi:hypothetical protein
LGGEVEEEKKNEAGLCQETTIVTKAEGRGGWKQAMPETEIDNPTANSESISESDSDEDAFFMIVELKLECFRSRGTAKKKTYVDANLDRWASENVDKMKDSFWKLKLELVGMGVDNQHYEERGVVLLQCKVKGSGVPYSVPKLLSDLEASFLSSSGQREDLMKSESFVCTKVLLFRSEKQRR